MVLHSSDQIFNILHLSSIICVGAQAYLLKKQATPKPNSISIQMYKNILPNYMFIQRQWTGLINISKLDLLIISPKVTLKSKLVTEGDFIYSI